MIHQNIFLKNISLKADISGNKKTNTSLTLPKRVKENTYECGMDYCNTLKVNDDAPYIIFFNWDDLLSLE